MSPIFNMLRFRCLGEIQIEMYKRRLAEWVALEKKLEWENVCISEAMGANDTT